MPGAADAYQCKVSEDFEFVSLWWPTRDLTYALGRGSTFEPRHIDTSFGAWSSHSCTDLNFEFVGVVDPNSDQNIVMSITEGWEDQIKDRKPRPREAVALTLTKYLKESGEILRSVIEVNEDLYQFVEVGQDQCVQGSGAYDLMAVVTHEIGHFIGLDHTEEDRFNGGPEDPTMAPEVGECEMDKRTLQPDDIDGLCHLYPAGGPPGRCLPLPVQAEGYVRNQAFGCETQRAPVGGNPWGALAHLSVLIIWFRFRIWS